MNRRAYIDWLRGISVLIMIEAHTLDAWTRLSERGNALYGWAMIVGGFAAPAFLFLAGLSMALAAGSRLRRGTTGEETASLAMRRRSKAPWNAARTSSARDCSRRFWARASTLGTRTG